MTVPRGSLRLPPVPRVHALASTTFRPPPLDGSLCVPELYDWHYEHSPDHLLFIYSDQDQEPTTITWREATRAIHKAGRLVQDLSSRREYSGRPVFAILSGNGGCAHGLQWTS